jgi:hypothetical protein
MSRTDRKGKRVGGPAFVQIFHWIRKTEAWRSLGPYSRLLYIELRGRYSGVNNGDISMSYREAEELLNCSNRPVIVAFRELQDRGFIVPIQKGSFSWKVRFGEGGRATTWRLTELPADWPERSLSPSQEFKSWVPTDQPENKRRREKSTPMGCKKHAIDDGMACKKHAYGVKKAPHSSTSDRAHGVQKACTSISTNTLAPVGQISSALLRSPLLKKAREETRRQSRKNGAAK